MFTTGGESSIGIEQHAKASALEGGTNGIDEGLGSFRKSAWSDRDINAVLISHAVKVEQVGARRYASPFVQQLFEGM
jgi:hypothetical protein